MSQEDKEKQKAKHKMKNKSLGLKPKRIPRDCFCNVLCFLEALLAFWFSPQYLPAYGRVKSSLHMVLVLHLSPPKKQNTFQIDRRCMPSRSSRCMRLAACSVGGHPSKCDYLENKGAHLPAFRAARCGRPPAWSSKKIPASLFLPTVLGAAWWVLDGLSLGPSAFEQGSGWRPKHAPL